MAEERTAVQTPAGFYASGGSIDEADIELKVKGFKTFQVVKPFVYVDKSGEVWPILPNQGEDTTDLASVPPWLWGLVASYGRQLAPALMHDYYCSVAKAAQLAADGDKAKIRAAYVGRRATDLRFREALRVKGVAWFRSNIFWAAVTFDRYRSFRWPLATLAIAQALAAAVGVVGAVAVWLFHWIRSAVWPALQAPPHSATATGHPWFWLLVAAIALVSSVVYGWNSMLAIGCGCIAAPVIAVELVVTLALATVLFVIDFAITGCGKTVTLGRANLNWPGLRPFRVRR
jgi:Protein of unknown function (DUF1353)